MTLGSWTRTDTREERDQVAHDLEPFARSAPLSFWIGLGTTASGWTWDDGVSEDAGTRPSIWGDLEPRAVTPPARAFMKITVGVRAYDTQLAHAAAVAEKLPYLCETRVSK